MGQKVNPHGLRVGVIADWNTTWYADKKEFSKFLKEDNVIRTFLKKKYYAAAISKILIERAATRIAVTIYTARPGVIIGKAGSEVEVIKKDLAKLTNGKNVSINITEVRKPDHDAQLVAEGVAAQLEKRMSFRRAMKQAIGRSMRSGVKGIKMMVSGRLDGAEIARSEHYHEGSIPLQTLRADIDYGFAEAHTTFGMIGVKCWIYKGEVIKSAKKSANEGGER
ncbi:MAG: 30S ribosomal protein S3 [Clostridia bacterium]|nr:30S ribosomal protein S3 [Clostridia bacterium]